MLPLAVVGAVGVGLFFGEAILYGGTAGTGYALGRKYGRKFCEMMDGFEERAVEIVTANINQKEE